MSGKFSPVFDEKLPGLVASGMTARQIGDLFKTHPDNIRSAVKRRGLIWRHPPRYRAKPTPEEPVMDHEGYIALVLAERPTGFLGHWSKKPGGYLYGRAA